MWGKNDKLLQSSQSLLIIKQHLIPILLKLHRTCLSVKSVNYLATKIKALMSLSLSIKLILV